MNEALLEQLLEPDAFRAADGVRLLDVLSTGDASVLWELFDSLFARIPHQWHTSGKAAQYESYYASVFYAHFAALGLDVRVEDATSRGRVDMAVLTPLPRPILPPPESQTARKP